MLRNMAHECCGIAWGESMHCGTATTRVLCDACDRLHGCILFGSVLFTGSGVDISGAARFVCGGAKPSNVDVLAHAGINTVMDTEPVTRAWWCHLCRRNDWLRDLFSDATGRAVLHGAPL